MPPKNSDPAAEMAELFPQLPAVAQLAYVALVRLELAGSRPTLEDLVTAYQKGYRPQVPRVARRKTDTKGGGALDDGRLPAAKEDT